MKPAKGYYSIIQYCPDLSRLEAANIGVLLFCPERRFLAARTARSNKRIREFFGKEGHDWARINSFKRGMEERLIAEKDQVRTLEDLNKFIELRANELQMTPPRPMRVEDEKRDLRDLFDKLVGGEDERSDRTTVRQLLRRKLRTPELERKVKTDIKVQVPILDRELAVPYGFQNGRFNLIQPASFRGEHLSVETTACRYAVEGRSLYEHRDEQLGELQLIVVGEFADDAEGKKATVDRILRENEVRLFAEAEVDRLVDEIRTTAKDIQG